MGKKKLKIYQEDAKLRQTTHWDLDYMTTAQIDALYGVQQSQKNLSYTKRNTMANDNHACKNDSGLQPLQRQQFHGIHGKAIMTTVLRQLRNLADLLRSKVRVLQSSMDR